MTDEQYDEPDFDDPAHAEVRDLLASARVDTPIPAEVAARLEATLADLTSSDLTSGLPTPHVEDSPTPAVVPFRRRSRVAPKLLAAAAAIVFAGAGAVGLNQVVQNTGGSDDMGAPTAAADSGGTVAPEAAEPDAPTTSTTRGLDSALDGLGYQARSRVPILTTADFADQAADLDLDRTSTWTRLSSTASEERAPAPSTPTSTVSEKSGHFANDGATAAQSRTAASEAQACTAPKIDGTTSYPVVLDGQPAVLVVHPTSDGSRLVEAWTCDATKVLVFAVVPD